MEQEHQVGSLNSCIGELLRQAYAQILELHDGLNLEENKLVCKKNYL